MTKVHNVWGQHSNEARQQLTNAGAGTELPEALLNFRIHIGSLGM